VGIVAHRFDWRVRTGTPAPSHPGLTSFCSLAGEVSGEAVLFEAGEAMAVKPFAR
jgi:hypothetical protein